MTCNKGDPIGGNFSTSVISTVQKLLTRVTKKYSNIHPSTRVHTTQSNKNIVAVAESVSKDLDQSTRRHAQAVGIF